MAVACFSALAALVFYGGWALWLNWSSPASFWWLPGLTQGVYAATQTFVVYIVVAWLYRWMSQRLSRPKLFTFLAASLLSICLPIVIQTLSGNMNTLLSILPGLVIGHCYLFVLVRRCSPTHSFS